MIHPPFRYPRSFSPRMPSLFSLQQLQPPGVPPGVPSGLPPGLPLGLRPWLPPGLPPWLLPGLPLGLSPDPLRTMAQSLCEQDASRLNRARLLPRPDKGNAGNAIGNTAQPAVHPTGLNDGLFTQPELRDEPHLRMPAPTVEHAAEGRGRGVGMQGWGVQGQRRVDGDSEGRR